MSTYLLKIQLNAWFCFVLRWDNHKKTDPFFQEQLDADKQVLATTVERKSRAERAAVGLLLEDVTFLNAIMNQWILGTILSDLWNDGRGSEGGKHFCTDFSSRRQQCNSKVHPISYTATFITQKVQDLKLWLDKLNGGTCINIEKWTQPSTPPSLYRIV